MTISPGSTAARDWGASVKSLVVPAKRSASRDPEPQACVWRKLERYLMQPQALVVMGPAFAGTTVKLVEAQKPYIFITA
jgi:hypothetical protein